MLTSKVLSRSIPHRRESPYSKFFSAHLFANRIVLREENEVSFTPRLRLSSLEKASREIQDKIWDKILMFVLYVESGQTNNRNSRHTQDWRKELLYVSKTFHVGHGQDPRKAMQC
jgi:hypothetical protein